MKSKVHGRGTNDSTEQVYNCVEGKKIACPYYHKWTDMLKRAFSNKFLEKNKSYLGCTVCEEWLLFSNFRDWMKERCWHGLDLDKDMLIKGNKHYSPETCVFIPRELNIIISSVKEVGRDLPLGVIHYNSTKNLKKTYVAQCGGNWSKRYLGYFSTPDEAHKAWQKNKVQQLESALDWYRTTYQYDSRVEAALKGRINNIKADILSGKQTIRV